MVIRIQIAAVVPSQVGLVAAPIGPIVGHLPPQSVSRKLLAEILGQSDPSTFAVVRSVLATRNIETVFTVVHAEGTASIAIAGTLEDRAALRATCARLGLVSFGEAIDQFVQSSSCPGWLVASDTGSRASAPANDKRSDRIADILGRVYAIKPLRLGEAVSPASANPLENGGAVPLTMVNLEPGSDASGFGNLVGALVPPYREIEPFLRRVKAISMAVSASSKDRMTTAYHLEGADDAAHLAEGLARMRDEMLKPLSNRTGVLGLLFAELARDSFRVSASDSDVFLRLGSSPTAHALLGQNTQLRESCDWSFLPPPAGSCWHVLALPGVDLSLAALPRATKFVPDTAKGIVVVEEQAGVGVVKLVFRTEKTALATLTLRLCGQIKLELGKAPLTAPLPLIRALDERGVCVGVIQCTPDSRHAAALPQWTAGILQQLSTEAQARLAACQEAHDRAENELQRARLGKVSGKALQPFQGATRDAKAALDRAGQAKAYCEGLKQRSQAAVGGGSSVLLTALASLESQAAAPLPGKEARRFGGQWLLDGQLLSVCQDRDDNLAGVVERMAPDAVQGVVGGRWDGKTAYLTLLGVDGASRSVTLAVLADGLQARDPKAQNTPVAYRVQVDSESPLWVQDKKAVNLTGYWIHATDKRHNTELRTHAGSVSGTSAHGGFTAQDFTGFVAGQIAFVVTRVERSRARLNPPNGSMLPMLADESAQKLMFLAPAAPFSPSGRVVLMKEVK